MQTILYLLKMPGGGIYRILSRLFIELTHATKDKCSNFWRVIHGEKEENEFNAYLKFDE